MESNETTALMDFVGLDLANKGKIVPAGENDDHSAINAAKSSASRDTCSSWELGCISLVVATRPGGRYQLSWEGGPGRKR